MLYFLVYYFFFMEYSQYFFFSNVCLGRSLYEPSQAPCLALGNRELRGLEEGASSRQLRSKNLADDLLGTLRQQNLLHVVHPLFGTADEEFVVGSDLLQGFLHQALGGRASGLRGVLEEGGRILAEFSVGVLLG